MDQNPYESPREAQSRQQRKVNYLPALAALLALTIIGSIGLSNYLRSLQLRQSEMQKPPVPKTRAASDEL